MEQMYNGHDPRNRPVSVGDWLLTMLLMVIPVVNFILLLVWAFGGGAPRSKSNWAKATLIWMLIGLVLAIFFWGSIAALVAGSGALGNW